MSGTAVYDLDDFGGGYLASGVLNSVIYGIMLIDDGNYLTLSQINNFNQGRGGEDLSTWEAFERYQVCLFSKFIL